MKTRSAVRMVSSGIFICLLLICLAHLVFRGSGWAGFLSFVALPAIPGLLAIAALLFLLKQRLAGLAALGAAILLAVPPLGVLKGQSTSAYQVPDVTILWLNARHSHVALDNIFDLDSNLQADIIAIAETPVNWRKRYSEELVKFDCIEWRHARGAPRLLVLSRTPCELASSSGDLSEYTPHRYVDLADSLRLVALHAPRPFDFSYISKTGRPWDSTRLQTRNDAIGEAAMRARQRADAVLIGDFNAVSWSPPLTELHTIGLQTVRCGPIWHSTWVDKHSGLGVPIDHVFVSASLKAICSVAPGVGSDHRPLVVRLYRADK